VTDNEAAFEAIRQVHEAWLAAELRGGVDGILRLCTPDVRWLVPGRPHVANRALPRLHWGWILSNARPPPSSIVPNSELHALARLRCVERGLPAGRGLVLGCDGCRTFRGWIGRVAIQYELGGRTNVAPTRDVTSLTTFRPPENTVGHSTPVAVR
jgi:hypothetical protein